MHTLMALFLGKPRLRLGQASFPTKASLGKSGLYPGNWEVDGYFAKLSEKHNVFTRAPSPSSWQAAPIVKHGCASICLYAYTLGEGANLCSSCTLCKLYVLL